MSIIKVDYGSVSGGGAGSSYDIEVVLQHPSTNGLSLNLSIYVDGTQVGTTKTITATTYGRVFDGYIDATIDGNTVKVRTYATDGSSSTAPIYVDVEVNGTLQSTFGYQETSSPLDYAYTRNFYILFA